MQITIDPATVSTHEWDALGALIASLRHPTATTTGQAVVVTDDRHELSPEMLKNIRAACTTDAIVTLAPEDNPSAGTATPTEVFAMSAPTVQDNAPVLTAKAGTSTYAEYIAAGWNDEQLIANGYLVVDTRTEAAAVFGATPAPLATSSGVSDATSSTAATLHPQLNDAATVFAATSATPAPPAANAPVDAPITSAVYLDTNGLPWDARIHAASRTANKDGSWKKKKGVDDATVATVTQELRGVIAADKAAAHRPLNAAASVPPPPAASVPPPPAASVPPPPAASVPPPPGAVVTFADVARYAGERAFPAEVVQQVCQRHGLPGLALLTSAPNLCAPILADFKAIP